MTIGIVNQTSPFQTQAGRDGVDMALVLATYDEEVRVFYKDEGVLQLIKNQQGELAGSKDFTATLKAFDLYDIEHVYVLASSLNHYQLSPESLSIDVEVLSTTAFYQAIAQCKHILSF